VAHGILGETHGPTVEGDAVLVDEVVVGGIGAGKPDHAPRRHVAIAAVDRIAKKSLERALPQLGEELIGWNAAERAIVALDRVEVGILVGRLLLILLKQTRITFVAGGLYQCMNEMLPHNA
jgi:hypothetical protein